MRLSVSISSCSLKVPMTLPCRSLDIFSRGNVEKATEQLDRHDKVATVDTTMGSPATASITCAEFAVGYLAQTHSVSSPRMPADVPYHAGIWHLSAAARGVLSGLRNLGYSLPY
ncbi:hypothetical protein D3C71_1686910 [compost metagenome]